MNLVKNDDIDEQSAMKYLEGQLKDPDWLNVVKNSFKYCHNKTKLFQDEVQQRSNFSKDECDVKYDVITSCMDIHIFWVSFKHLLSIQLFVYSYFKAMSTQIVD